MREVSAGIIIYRKTKEGPRFLLIYEHGRYWNFPKGKLENNGGESDGSFQSQGRENSFQAAVREVQEETGLKRNELFFDQRFKVYDRFTFSQNKRKVFKLVTFFLAETKNPVIKIAEEHQGYGWFLYRDAQRILIHKNLKDNLRKVHDLIRGKNLFRREKNTQRPGVDLPRSSSPRG